MTVDPLVKLTVVGTLAMIPVAVVLDAAFASNPKDLFLAVVLVTLVVGLLVARAAGRGISTTRR